jgi:hypothetical protein
MSYCIRPLNLSDLMNLSAGGVTGTQGTTKTQSPLKQSPRKGADSVRSRSAPETLSVRQMQQVESAIEAQISELRSQVRRLETTTVLAQPVVAPTPSGVGALPQTTFFLTLILAGTVVWLVLGHRDHARALTGHNGGLLATLDQDVREAKRLAPQLQKKIEAVRRDLDEAVSTGRAGGGKGAGQSSGDAGYGAASSHRTVADTLTTANIGSARSIAPDGTAPPAFLGEEIGVELDESERMRTSNAPTPVAFARLDSSRARLRLNPSRIVENTELRRWSAYFAFPDQAATGAMYETVVEAEVECANGVFGDIRTRGSVRRTE